MKRRLTVLTVGVFLISASILGRAVWVQIIGDQRLQNLAQRQFRTKVLLRPRRGVIVDRTGEALAVNAETKSLAANPKRIEPKEKQRIGRLLSRATGVSLKRIQKKLESTKSFVWIKRDLPSDKLKKLKDWGLMDEEGGVVEGLLLVKESKRVYPNGTAAAHILGSVNVDLEGLEGIELWKNEDLRGKVVSVRAVKDAFGRPTFLDAVAALGLQKGETVQLTLDASLQFTVERELDSTLAESKARAGTAIVMNAETGDILAMASRPTFNPNQRGGAASLRRNRVLTDGFEPGSSIKAILMASALSNGWDPDVELWGGLGSVVVQGREISDHGEKHKWLTLEQIIQFSSNVGAAKVALKLGAKAFHFSLRAFGFGEKTGIGFPGEFGGMLPAVDSISDIRLANIGFGQGFLATPLQVARAYATFLNGGYLVEPKLIQRVGDLDFNEVRKKRIITPGVADQVVRALIRATSNEGTAPSARLDGYAIAGKTGTSQVIDPATKKYSKSHYVASFVGFAVGVEPKLVIFTSIDRPKGNYYGGQVAAPLFNRIFQAAASRFSVPSRTTEPTPRKLLAEMEGRGKQQMADELEQTKAHPKMPSLRPEIASLATAFTRDRVKILWEGKRDDGKMIWKVPDFTGMSPREVVYLLQGYDFKLKVKGFGRVSKQVPPPGGVLVDGQTVVLESR